MKKYRLGRVGYQNGIRWIHRNLANKGSSEGSTEYVQKFVDDLTPEEDLRSWNTKAFFETEYANLVLPDLFFVPEDSGFIGTTRREAWNAYMATITGDPWDVDVSVDYVYSTKPDITQPEKYVNKYGLADNNVYLITAEDTNGNTFYYFDDLQITAPWIKETETV